MSYHLTSPMPPVLSVRCPSCGECSEFEHATVQVIQKNNDIDFFKKSSFFEFEDTEGHPGYAIYFPRLGRDLENLESLPDGYDIKDWQHDKYWGHRSCDMGVLQCNNCFLRSKHNLKWPEDAYFKVEYKGDWLWAFDKATAELLLNYIASDERNKTISGFIQAKSHKIEVKGYHRFLLKIPEKFQARQARGPIVKKLRKVLA